jgi:hypothetical protein
MKKIIFVLVLSFSATIPSFSATDPQTVQFLEKLNQYYYCLSREGVKGFRGEITMTFSKERRNTYSKVFGKKIAGLIESEKFSTSVTADGLVTINPEIKIPIDDPSDNLAVENELNSHIDIIKMTLNYWALFMLNPLNGQSNYDNGCIVENNSDGFSVLEKRGDFETTCYYDKNAKMKIMVSKKAGRILRKKKLIFTKSSKGYVFEGIADSFNYTYEKNGKYKIPRKILFPKIYDRKTGEVMKGASITYSVGKIQIIQ